LRSPRRVYASAAAFVVRRLAALAATIVIAPAVSFVVFDLLSKDYFAPDETFTAMC
jgi:hypothetical protein